MITADANWIWDSGPQQPVNSYMYMRKVVDLPTEPMKVIVHVSADSRYKLYVNGKLVGRGPVRSDPRWQQYDTYDLTRDLHKGRNSIAALVHHYGINTFTYHLGRGGFLFDGQVTYPSPPQPERTSGGVRVSPVLPAKELSILSDDSWRVKRADAWFSDILRISIQQEFYEVYDANKAIEGWTDVGFDDSKWERATVIDQELPWSNLTERTIPFLYEKEIFPVAVTQAGIADPTEVKLPADNKFPIAFIMSHEKKTRAEGLVSNTSALFKRPNVEDIFKAQPINPRGPKESVARKKWQAANESGPVCTVNPLPPDERGQGKAVYLIVDFGREIAGMPRIKVSTKGTGAIDLGYGELLNENGTVHPNRAGVNYADRYIIKPDHASRVSKGDKPFMEFRYLSNVQSRANPKAKYIIEVERDSEGKDVYSFTDQKGNPVEASKVLAGSTVVLTSDDLKGNARPERSPYSDQTMYLALEFDDKGRKVFADFTRKHIDEYLAVVVGGRILSAPVIKDAILDGKALIQGGFKNIEEAAELADALNGVGPLTSQEWEVFDRRGFRYMQIDFRDITEPVTVESVSVNFNTYPVQWKGEFTCSDKRLNDIWRIGAYTVQLNMEDAYTDCPWRERTQWWGDARLEAMSNYYAFGDYKLIRQGIVQIGQSQKEDGSTACFYPGVFDQYIPSFCLVWVGSIWDYYTYTGDAELVKEMYPKVEKLIGFFEKFRDKNGLISNVQGWMFIEWTQTEYEGAVGVLNCFYYETLTHASNMARLAGDTKGAEKYAAMASALQEAINTRLFDPVRGAYPEWWSEEKQAFSPKTSQMPNALVAAYDIAPEQRRIEVLRYCMDPANKVIPAGSYFAYYWLQALLQHGMVQESLDYMRKNWGVMLDWGATTFWEHWNTDNSLCHGWASAPTAYLPGYILGVRPAEPGFRRVTIAPNTADLRWARGIVPTPLGDIKAEWKKTRDGLEMRITIPKGMTADVSLPGGSPFVIKEAGSYVHTVRRVR